MNFAVRISCCNQDCPSITHGKIHRDIQARIIRIVEYDEPSIWDVGQPSFDHVHVACQSTNTSNVCEAALDIFNTTCINPEDTPKSRERSVSTRKYVSTQTLRSCTFRDVLLRILSRVGSFPILL